MILLENLSKIYPTIAGPRIVLDNINVTIPTTKSVGILGRNGTGKSTLMRLVARAESPTKGRITTTARISWPLAFSGGFQATLSAVDNIRFVSRIYGEDWQRITKVVEEFTELGTYMRMPVRTFSSGMRARLSLALSLAIKFDVYLVDEIPGVADVRFKKRFDEAFQRLCKESSLFLVSHSPSSVRQYCQIACLLHNGKLTMYEDVDAALAAYEAT